VTTDQWFTLLIASLGVIFTIMSALVALLWRSGVAAGRTSTQMQNLVEDVARIADAIDEHIKWHLANRR
jgi:hypothetical protein